MTPQQATPPQDATQAISDQHKDIRDVLTTLDQTSQLSDVLVLLRELKEVLIPHFAEEERPGGLYETVLTGAPRNAGQLDRLLAEHRELLVELEGLIEQIQLCLAGPVAEAITRARTLQARLRAHEESEGSIVADALYQDLGVGD